MASDILELLQKLQSTEPKTCNHNSSILCYCFESFLFYVRAIWKCQLFLILPIAIQTVSIEVAQNKDQWFYLVNMVFILLDPRNEGTLLNSWLTIIFSSSLVMELAKFAFKRNPVKTNKCKLEFLINSRFNMIKV